MTLKLIDYWENWIIKKGVYFNIATKTNTFNRTFINILLHILNRIYHSEMVY